MNTPTTQLKDLIHVEKGIIPPELCDACVDDIKRRTGWQPHEWYSNDSGQISLDDKNRKELDILFAGRELDNKLKKYGDENYYIGVGNPTSSSWKNFCNTSSFETFCNHSNGRP